MTPEELEQKIAELEGTISSMQKSINSFNKFMLGFLSAAEVDPQVVRTLQQVLGGITLETLADVSLSSPSNGEVLKYNGTVWENGTDDIGAS